MSRLALAVLAAAALVQPSQPTRPGFGPVPRADASTATCWSAPVSAPVADPYRPPACRWCPGNRGIEYASEPGDEVRAVTAGEVTFDGLVAGRRHLTVARWVPGSRLLITIGGLDPADDRLPVGATVGRDEPLGRATGPVHLGVRRAGEYLDPAIFLDAPARRPRLVPTDGTPGRSPGRRGGCG